jgi:hypothetical protein
MKTLSALKEYKKNHYTRYKQSDFVGPIRALGRIKALNRHGGIVIKEVPAFRGVCQAIGTGDTFIITMWDNGNGNYRFEICEKDSYSQKNVSPIF